MGSALAAMAQSAAGAGGPSLLVPEQSKMEALLWLQYFLKYFLRDYDSWADEEERYLQNKQRQR